ncbi:MAG: hypothetical protein Q8877_02555, partial [Sweet potato little leaf phytoplasma]|nr:hypothetical protein [Sweet potato little leaf phytoplasma]
NHLIPELVRSELLINANIYDMTCDNDLGLILNKIVTALEIHQKYEAPWKFMYNVSIILCHIKTTQ